MCFILDSGKKPDYPEKMHTDVQTPQRKTWAGIKPQSFANHCITMPTWGSALKKIIQKNHGVSINDCQ